MEVYSYEGKKANEVFEKALSDLNVTEAEILYHKQINKGGFLKSDTVKFTIVKLTEVQNAIKSFLEETINNMGLEVKFETNIREKQINIKIFSNNNSILIGKDGKNMAALSTIIRQAVYNELGFFYKFNLDVGEYKLKQQKNIERMAKSVARDVAKSKVEAKLEPMNSYERRIVHNILNDDKYVYTESFGEEPNRYVVIKPRED